MPAPVPASSPKIARIAALTTVEADKAVDNRGDAHQELDKRLEDAAAKTRLDLHHKDGATKRDGQREERCQEHDAKGSHNQRKRTVDAVGGDPSWCPR